MTKLQKLKLIDATKDSYNARLNELRHARFLVNAGQWNSTKAREAALEQALRYCEYLRLEIMRGTPPGTQMAQMLHYIGLDELTGFVTTEPGEKENE